MHQILTQGVVLGPVDGQADFVWVSDGIRLVQAYVAGDTSNLREGMTFNLYKQNSTYFLGQQLNGTE